MSDGVIVHCPRCGATFHMNPAVDQTAFYGDTTLRITFRFVDTDHQCDRTQGA